MKKPSISSIVTLMLLLHVAPPALAIDGVLEINQTCAVQTGCFPGDGAGFPVTIATGGSYRLTSRLDITASVVAGIVVDADLVSIDLNGFSIVGQPAFPTADGIGYRFADPFNHTTVSNGTVRGFTQGLNLGSGSRVEDVRVLSNLGVGILLRGGIVTGSTVEGNYEGILVWKPPGQALIVRTVIRNNNPTGGLYGDGRAAYVGNVFTGHLPFNDVSASVQIGPNQCGTNTTCP